MRCPKCRKELREGAKFCPSCGTRVSNHKRNRRFRVFIIIILILSAILGGVGIGILAARIVGNSNSVPEIHSAEEAIAYAKELGTDLGYKNAMSELTEKVTTEFDGDCYYRLQQNYRGIPVYGHTLVYVTGENGRVTSISGNLEDVYQQIDLEPSITQSQIEESIFDYLQNDLGYTNIDDFDVELASDDCLLIYQSPDDHASHLAYCIQAGCYEILVDAHDAQVLFSDMLIRTATVIGDLNGQRQQYRSVCYSEDDNNVFRLDDNERLIKSYVIKNKFNLLALGFVRADAINVAWEENESPSADAVDAYVNTQIVYQYFAEKLKHKSADGLGKAEIWVITGYDKVKNSEGEYINYRDNAFSSASKDEGYMSVNFGIADDFDYSKSACIDWVAHEYMHGIEKFHSAMYYSGESGAIMEGLSDIFGELAEAWHNEQAPNWFFSDSSRDMVNPEGKQRPVRYKGTYWQDTADLKQDNGGVHINSTVISHAAYLMWNGIDGTNDAKELSENELAELWYRAMLMMPSDCTFAECRILVELAAASMDLTDMQVQCIGEAFDTVGIKGAEDILVDYQIKPGCELSVLGTDGSAYDNYTVSISGSGIYTYYQKNSPALYYGLSDYHTNSVVTNIDPFTLPTQEGAYTITISDNENPASSVSFVIDVSRENTKDILQIFTEFENQANIELPSYYQAVGNVHCGESSIQLNADHTFTCTLKDYDWGDQGDDYPNGTCYISQFEGKFSKITTIDEFRLKLTVEYIEQTNQPGDQYIQDGMRFIVEEDDTLAQLKECRMYLPGTPFEFTDDCFATLDGGEKMFYIGPYYGDLQELMAGRFALELDENMLIFLGELESDGNQESEPGYDASNLVSDAYSDYVSQNLYNLEAYFHIPKVNANLPEIEKTNAKIYSDYYDYMQKNVYGSIEEGSNTPIDEISYIWEVKDQYLSILMYVMWAAKPSCEVYTVSLETGALVENSELLTAYGITEEGFNELVGQASQKIGDSLRWPIPYVNPETKDLCAVGSSEKWGYDKLVNLTGTTEPFYPWEIPAPERVAEALAGAE